MLNYINGMSSRADNDVEVHAQGCKDLMRKLNSFDYDDAGEVPVMDPSDLWLEYNADFMEDGRGWPITIYPCTGIVDKKITFAGV